MNWADKRIWKDCFIATFICLCGCSIGTMGITNYLMNHSWLFVLLISLVSGFISCMVFMIAWNMIFRKMTLKGSIEHSYKMSLISMFIMMLTENIILSLVHSQHASHQMRTNSSQSFQLMLVAMCCGFILALPYNYYQLHKTGQICH